MEIIHGVIDKTVSAGFLEENLNDYFKDEDSLLYFGFPIINTQQGAFSLDALVVSKSIGVLIFQLEEGTKVNDNYRIIQDECYSKMYSKLFSNMSLLEKKVLCVPIHVITFAPAYHENSFDKDYPICSIETLSEYLDSIEKWNGKKYNEVLSVIQSVTNIRKNLSGRIVRKNDSKGAKLKSIEDAISTLDALQSRAVIETVSGVQRIRGLAGSGKTIVLALKAAYLHATNPEWKIAITFHSRSLKDQFKNLINKFYIEQTSSEPNWNMIHILNSWGAAGDSNRHGMYYLFCQKNGIEYYDYGAAQKMFGKEHELDEACKKALNDCLLIEPEYDAILIDEAQDLPPSFLKLCYSFLKEPKRLVYAYDELQSLNENRLPSPELIFGNDANGKPLVDLKQTSGKSKPDIILEKCYRNSRQALVTAHAIGFGIYRETDSKIGTGIIQMFENRELWTDIGYKCIEGSLRDGEMVKLMRTEESSPTFLEEHSSDEELINFYTFNDKKKQDDWVTSQIIANIKEDELKASDILVINPNPKTTRGAVGDIRNNLLKMKINNHIAGIDTSADTFFRDDSITFTGIFRAKGNEAAMVYVINAQDCYDSFGSLAKVRNELFTAITRSKAWVKVCGYGPNMEKLADEFNKIKENDFTLKFRYPTKEQRNSMKIVNRDMSEEEKKKVEAGNGKLISFVKDLENGELHLEDIDNDTLQKLKLFINGEKNEK